MSEFISLIGAKHKHLLKKSEVRRISYLSEHTITVEDMDGLVSLLKFQSPEEAQEVFDKAKEELTGPSFSFRPFEYRPAIMPLHDLGEVKGDVVTK